jgi:Tfp pilus assembly protein PilO
MILIPRKGAMIILFVTLIVSTLGSFLYFSGKTYTYVSKLEQKFMEVRSVFRNIAQLETQLKQLENVRASVYSVQSTFAKDEMTPEQVKEKLYEVLSSGLLTTDYIVIKASLSEPIVFKKLPVKYTMIIRGSE